MSQIAATIGFVAILVAYAAIEISRHRSLVRVAELMAEDEKRKDAIRSAKRAARVGGSNDSP